MGRDVAPEVIDELAERIANGEDPHAVARDLSNTAGTGPGRLLALLAVRDA